MRVLDPGHHYGLEVLDTSAKMGTFLTFVKRRGPKYPGNKEAYAGTTSQEVLRALIDRAFYVNNQTPCWQTKLSIYLMGAVVWLYEHRAARRHKRKSPGFYAATFGETCRGCGHVGCDGCGRAGAAKAARKVDANGV